MAHTTVEVDLVRQARVLQDNLTLVAFFGREDEIGLGCRNGQGTFDCCEFILGHKAWMRIESSIDLVEVWV